MTHQNHVTTVNIVTIFKTLQKPFQNPHKPLKISKSSHPSKLSKSKTLTYLSLVYNPPPAFRPKISIFLRNRGRWFRIWSWFVQYCSSFGDIWILQPFGICTRSTRTSWSCSPWSKFLRCFWVIRVYEGFEGFSMVFVILIWRNNNIFEIGAVLNKPRLDSESATSIT